VGVSAGPDSVALLYLLNSLKKELNLRLHIAHLDHKLRKDSYKDRIFVEKLAQKLKMPITTKEIDIRAKAQKGSLEEIARNARLGFLFGVAKNIKAKKVALGHNLDDQAETVLMRILRGTGLYGLSGILPKRKFAGYQIIRPLIETRRKDIEAYLKRRKIKPRIDYSNLEDIYFRNKIRNRLLPLLEKEYNKNIKELLSNMAQSLGYDYDYLIHAAKRLMKQNKTRLNLKKIMKLHPAIRRLLFRLAITKVKQDTRRITFQHIREIEDLLFNRPLNSIVDLPKGVSVAKNKKSLSFYSKTKLQ
jgi:tRNA(Ile)-lysidine synthase